MAKNFLIVYTARDGSSALINLLSKHPNVVVPLFEGMDPYALPKPLGDAAPELERIFTTGEFDGIQPNPGEIDMRRLEDTPEGEASIGFKWRFWGDNEKVCQELKSHDVKVFFLFRRDFTELVSSIHLSEQLNVKKGGEFQNWHPQFEYLAADKTERKAMKKELEETRVRINPLKFLRIIARRIVVARRQRHIAKHLAAHGVETEVIFYEDFKDDNRGFVNDMLRDIGQSELPSGESDFQKPTSVPAKDRLLGLNFWEKTGVLPLCTKFYRSFVLSI